MDYDSAIGSENKVGTTNKLINKVSIKEKRVCITLKGPLNDDVGIVIRIFGKHLRESCPRICLALFVHQEHQS